ncbi:MAG: hypothetical protein R2759_13355 [Bacteroidales bacterium]
MNVTTGKPIINKEKADELGIKIPGNIEDLILSTKMIDFLYEILFFIDGVFFNSLG